MNKKTQGLNLTTVTIAALFLLLFFIFLIIFIGKFYDTNTIIEKNESVEVKIGVNKSCEVINETLSCKVINKTLYTCSINNCNNNKTFIITLWS